MPCAPPGFPTSVPARSRRPVTLDHECREADSHHLWWSEYRPLRSCSFSDCGTCGGSAGLFGASWHRSHRHGTGMSGMGCRGAACAQWVLTNCWWQGYYKGSSEELLGSANACARFTVDTKFPGGFLDKASTAKSILAGAKMSLERLKTGLVRAGRC